MKKIIRIMYIGVILIISLNQANALSLDTKTVLRNGSAGQNVKDLQTMLNKLSNCNLPITGKFYNQTKECVKKYQRNYGLKVDGSVGPETSDSINKEYARLMGNDNTTKIYQQDYNNISSYVTLLNVNLTKGNVGDNVRLLQQELNKILPSCNLIVDGSYGSSTKECVQQVQRNNKLNTVGNVDEKLRTIINHNYLDNRGIIINNLTNVREAPNASSKPLYTLNRGTTVYLHEFSKNWYYVSNGYGTTKGYVHKDNLSSTFIEVDVNSQVLRFYKDGQLYLDTIVTTGKYGSNDTPKKYYNIEFKSTNQYLKSSNVTVDYWMAITSDGIYGIHSAKSWRDNFVKKSLYEVYGGKLYKSSGAAGSRFSGSHGCINTPIDKIKVLYDNVPLKTPVLVY